MLSRQNQISIIFKLNSEHFVFFYQNYQLETDLKVFGVRFAVMVNYNSGELVSSKFVCLFLVSHVFIVGLLWPLFLFFFFFFYIFLTYLL